jgi:acyl transferase domain-containing protein
MQKNKEEFWENIKTRKNCIEAIPKDRWDYRDYVSNVEAADYSQYGSFIKELNMFNPLLFNVSPRDAELMDPQLRKLMEVTLSAIDDAGYTKEKMNDTGVFIGNIHCEYSKIASDPMTAGIIAMTAQYDLANKLSNVFDFVGPSLVVNTACSSSLTAIHAAMSSLRNDECRYAVVGGANLQLSPERFIGLKEVGIIGNQEYSAPFGEENGFVLGEGIGVIILKKLTDAQNDHDNIYGVIRSSVCRHMGGKEAFGDIDERVLKSITKETFSRSGISPKSIQLIETGANGVSALDVAEFNCLNEVFTEAKVPTGSVAVSSVKSNYGNIEAASGIAQVVKVLMQMKEHVFVPSINIKNIAPDIERNGPLSVQTEKKEWSKSSTPRRALISTVGAGGNVVQLICEEYIQEQVEESFVYKSDRFVYLISAPEKTSLNKTVECMLEYISDIPLDAKDIAYTLQNGRESYRCRLAFIASTQDEIIKKLQAYLDKDETSIYSGTLKASAKKNVLGTQEVVSLIEQGKVEELAKKWIEGFFIDWEELHSYFGGKRIHIPGLITKKKKYWIESNEKELFELSKVQSLEEFIAQIFGELLKMNVKEMEFDENLQRYGLDSLLSMRAINKMNELFNIEIQPSRIMNLGTINDIVFFLKSECNITFQDIQKLSEDKTSEVENDDVPLDIRDAITDILLKKVINGDICVEKVSEIDELLFS